jgi:hypothetical protein
MKQYKSNAKPTNSDDNKAHKDKDGLIDCKAKLWMRLLFSFVLEFSNFENFIEPAQI